MSMQRKIKRAIMQQAGAFDKKRTTCKRCKAKLVEKNGYGWVCAECGWERDGGKQDAD